MTEPEEIKQQIEVTKTAISDKLVNLETEVKDSVEVAKKEVGDIVQTVKRTFDIGEHVRRYPFAWLGGAVLVGFVARKWIVQPSNDEHYVEPFLGPAPRRGSASINGQTLFPEKVEKPKSTIQTIAGQFDEEFHQIKNIALGSLIGWLGNLAKNMIPKPKSQRVSEGEARV